ncbi:MAG TPA: hypothetical protein VLF67_03875, partial [Candidatus Saccharimonas sp.]|nr:hypothetical protein [Candidatus Saccharimonas sp.]
MGLLDKLLGRNRTAPSEKSVPARTPAPRPATPTQPAARAATGDSAVLAEINRLVAAFVATRRSPGRPLDDVR